MAERRERLMEQAHRLMELAAYLQTAAGRVESAQAAYRSRLRAAEAAAAELARKAGL
jgi:hypothetical protein